MNEIYIAIEMQIGDAAIQELLIAQLSDSMEIDGFEQQEVSLKMFIKDENFKEEIFKNIIDINSIKYSKSIIRNENWNAKWESSFSPVIIDKFVAVRADFHSVIDDVEYEIIITPKMSFGTGHHATTSMMLECLNLYQPAGRSVIDFGTGTGVLAILAEKMGATEIVAIDYDDWSINNARENILKNKCTHIELKQADHFPVDKHWDIILANINLNVILDSMAAFAKGIAVNGILVVSGILKENKDELFKTAGDHGFVAESEKEKNNWLCVAFKKVRAD
jgi:ribosomal protein L11 methyltransferase